MYARVGYYERSGICFAYLIDVDVESSSQREDIATSLASSRWFTREWTSQELIAPAVTELYNKDWVYIGAKIALSSTLEKLMSVPQGLFTQAWYRLYAGGMARQLLHLLSVAQELSWAAKRETTRAKNIAYCLMGLFEVNMPLLMAKARPRPLPGYKQKLRRAQTTKVSLRGTLGMTKLAAMVESCGTPSSRLIQAVSLVLETFAR